MDRERIAKSWENTKSLLQRQWSLLTASDLDRIQGRRSTLIEMIQLRYQRPYADVEREIDRWERDYAL